MPRCSGPALDRRSGLWREFESSVENLKERITARVASVTRQLERVQTPIAFDETGVAKLSAWRFKAPNDHPASGGRTAEEGRQLLEVHAQGGVASSGAWRTVVLLAEGHYEFKGVGRATGILHSATNTGVMLRVSGERSPKGLSTNENWSPLRYEFDVHGIANTELVAEFRGAHGSGAFDIERFKLVRKGKVSETKFEEQ